MPHPPVRRRSRVPYGAWTPVLAVLCVAAGAALAGTLMPKDLERYWLLYAGDWQLLHGRILESLQGSWFPDRAWTNQEWLVALLTAWTRAHGLYVVTELFFGASMIFGLLFVAYETVRTRTHPLVACVQVAATGLGVVFFAQDRAQTLVWALLPGLILVWRRAPWTAVPILALWANVHGSFPIGVLWMALHLDRRRVLPFVAAALATLANPLGWHLWEFTLLLARNAHLAGYVNEWTPTLHSPTGVLIAVLALAPLWMRLLGGIRLRHPVRIGDLLWTLAIAIGSIIAMRYVMLLFLTTATTLGAAFRTRARPMPLATTIASLFFSLLVLSLCVRGFVAVRVLADPWFGTLERGVDFAACAPLVRGKRVFTDALQIGSLIELGGGSVNVDGRIDAFPAHALRDADTVLNHPKDAAFVVGRLGAQALALEGAWKPPARSWHAAARCGEIKIYERSG
ncbi:MAG TPA: hypothetical protein VIN40_01710 [Candidatus Tyrphobacter sp.]